MIFELINGVLYRVPDGEALGIPKRHLAVFGVTRDSGKTTFVESAVAASGMKAIVFRTKRGELGFENAKPLPLFFDERGLTHWKALEGLVAATLDEKVQREPGVRYAFMTLCKEPTQAQTLEEIYQRVVEKLKEPKLREWPKEIFTKVKNYLEEVLPQLKKLQGRFTDKLELPEPGVYVEDLVGLSDELQNLFVASLIRKVYEELSGVIVVVAEIWKFLPQDRGSPVKWVIEKYVREMGVVEGWLWLDAQDLRGVDKKHLRSFDVRLFGRQPDAHEIDEILKALPLPKQQKPKPEQIMTLKLGFFYAKLKDRVELVYVRPVWLPESVAVRVARGELEPDSEEVQLYKPKPKQSRVSEDEDLTYKPLYEKEKEKREETQTDLRIAEDKLEEFEGIDVDALQDRIKTLSESDAKLVDSLEEAHRESKEAAAFREALTKFLFPNGLPIGLPTMSTLPTGLPTTSTPGSTESSEILVVTENVPEIHHKIERPSVETNESTLEGRLVTLAIHNFFESKKRSNHIAQEISRVYAVQVNLGDLNKALGALVQKKILQREATPNRGWEYWLYPGAKERIKEVEA